VLELRGAVSGKPTKKTPRKARSSDELRPHYDFSKGVRGKYAKEFARGTNLVLLEPDVARAFKSSRSVNRVLRAYLAERKRGAGGA
jgi:hypothetical protein